MSTVATPAPTPRRRRRSRLQRRQARLAWLLLLPALAVVAFVAIYPLGKTVYQSFTNQEFLAGIEPTKWVGLQNYRDLWHDTVFRQSVWETIKFTLITVSFEFVLGIIIALVVNSNFKGRGAMRAAMLVPWAIPTVVAAQMWKWMFDDVDPWKQSGALSPAGFGYWTPPDASVTVSQPSVLPSSARSNVRAKSAVT